MFVKTFKDAYLKKVEERKKNLLERDLEEGTGGKYYEGYDSDEVDNGVGYQTVRYDILQNEDKAEEDAKEELLQELENEDFETIYEMFQENNALRNATIELLRGL